MAAAQETNAPTTAPTASWTLAPATVDDTKALVDVHAAAFRADLFSALMLLGRPDDAHHALMRKTLEVWFADPQARLTKAVDADGHIVAWACWILRDNDSTATEVSQEAKEKKTTESPPEAAAAATTAATTTPAAPATSSAPNDDPTRPLRVLMREDMLRREAAHMPRGKCLVLQGLATHPRLQGRGIGSQLVREGTERADAEGLPCWAHASAAGHAVYARNGFREVARDEYPLATWAPGGEGGNRGWGTYTFRHMLRPVGGDESGGV